MTEFYSSQVTNGTDCGIMKCIFSTNCTNFFCLGNPCTSIKCFTTFSLIFFRSINYCRIFTEMAESFLDVITHSPNKVRAPNW